MGDEFDFTLQDEIKWKQLEEQNQADLREKVLETGVSLLKEIDRYCVNGKTNHKEKVRLIGWSIKNLLDCVENPTDFVQESRLSAVGWLFVCKVLHFQTRFADLTSDVFNPDRKPGKTIRKIAWGCTVFIRYLSAYSATYLQLK